MEKTIKEWFEYLPSDIREKAIRYTSNRKLKEKRDCLSHAIFHAFAWSGTNEGQKYWSEIRDNSEKNKYQKGIKKKLSL